MSSEAGSLAASNAAGDGPIGGSSVPHTRIDDWQQRWQSGRIGFHLSSVNDDLVACYGRLVPADQSCTILVPLCGKSVDMVWLHARGHTVVGVEAVRQAVLEFFAESGLQYTETRLSDSAELFQSTDGRLRVFRADVFDLSPSQLPPIDCVWDRAAYVALQVADRRPYAALLRSVLPPGGRLLLSLLQYSSPLAEAAGPPRSVAEHQFRPEFQHVADIECLIRRPRKPGEVRPLIRYEAFDIEENVYLLTKR